MTKETLRKGMIAALTDMAVLERKKVERTLHKRLFSSEFWEKAKVIGLTLSQDLEWDTRAIVKQAWAEGKQVAVPKSIHSTRELHFYEIDDFSQVEVGYYGIEEPIVEKTTKIEKEGIDSLLVPGVLFNREGYRIGFGGGYYDRFLKDYTGRTLSLIHSNQLIEELPVEEHDIPVQYICTETELIICGNERGES